MTMAQKFFLKRNVRENFLKISVRKGENNARG